MIPPRPLRRVAVSVLSFAALLVVTISAQNAAQTSKAASKKSLRQDYSFKVKAHRIWTDTGLDLYPGDRIHVTGAVAACNVPSLTEKAHLPLPSAPGGALLVELHSDGPAILASPDIDLPILDPSHLYLGVNGEHCHGTIPVSVHVDWHKPEQTGH
ncbi:MAG: hypothetical protein WA609_17795 [Terriglobales bacterium]